MPRPLVFGNGRFLVGIDDQYAIRDLFFPHVGEYNHLSGHRIRMGVWLNGRFSWCDDDGWERRLAYCQPSMVSDCTLRNDQLGVELTCSEQVHTEQPLYARHILVRNLDEEPSEIRLFFTHDLHIRESDIGDTAFYLPQADAVIHYKGEHYFLVGGWSPSGGVYEYACGIKGFGGLEGTWRDAEDGHLSMNPIAQGSVDSTFSLRATTAPGQAGEFRYHLACGHSREEVVKLYYDFLIDYAWMVQPSSEEEVRGSNLLHEDSVLNRFLCQSLYILKTHVDESGAIIAATDTDIMETNRATYSYCWPRDGALVAEVLSRLGQNDEADRFYSFCSRLVAESSPFFFQKYTSRGSPGASWHPWIFDGRPETPIQEDETALVVLHAFEHRKRTGVDETPWADWLRHTVQFLADHVDPATQLPLPSYDLWEERRGIHTFTVAAVVAALRAAADSPAAERPGHLRSIADAMRDALRKHLFDTERGVFYRRLAWESHRWAPDPVVDSSTLQVALLGALPADDEMVRSNVEVVRERLWVNSQIGGLARYEGDYYFRRVDHFAGNPWIICTMWLAQHLIMAADKATDLEEPEALLRWAMSRAASSGVLPEQVHPETGEHLSVSPLTWSHAEVLKTALDLREKRGALNTGRVQ